MRKDIFRRTGITVIVVSLLTAILWWSGSLRHLFGLGAYIEQGGWTAIQDRGRIRFLMPRLSPIEYLPRSGRPEDFEMRLIDEFGRATGLEVIPVRVDDRDELIPALLAGRGDIIAASFTITPERQEQVAFSAPFLTVREQVVVPKNSPIHGLADLKGRTVAVRESSSYRESLKVLKTEHPFLEILAVPEDVDTLTILSGVAEGRYEATVADDHIVQIFLSYENRVRPAFSLKGDRHIAWAVRPDNPELLDRVNGFLSTTHLPGNRPTVYRADLDEIRKRGVLRVLTRNNAATYFIWRGQMVGFEYEMVRKFAEEIGVRLQMVVPPTREDLFPWLLEGRGDVIAASMTASSEREQREGVRFSRPYNKVFEVVVARASEKGLEGMADLKGRTITVRKSSSYWTTLESLREAGAEFDLEPAPELLETEEIIGKVAKGEYDLTVADSHILDIELTWREDVKGAFALEDPVSHGWAVRPEDEKLLAAVNRFLKSEYRGLFYNMTLKKYFKNPKKIRSHIEFRAKTSGALSPYDDLVKTYAGRYDFDWRLIVALMYQESRFDPEVRSFAGARGLMQMLPKTARALGFEDLTDPETSIQAGVKYLDRLRKYFEPELPVHERMNFILAAYNAGQGHVRDARILARELGLNPDRWFDHVEKAMGLLSKRKYARNARFGYVRGHETVKFLREIRRHYRAYTAVASGI
ncbi:MAG: membrane-bound lytic murein transglycosylase MltF [Thermodesulfobacteriota bacterium]